MNILVFAPHPDDEVIGVGGTILRHKKAGDNVCVVFCTKAFEPYWTKEVIALKAQEVKNVCKFLKIDQFFWLDFKTASLNSIPAIDLSKKMEEIIQKVDPDIIYAPPKGDIHIDHDICATQILSASRKGPHLKKILFYEEPQNTQDNISSSYFIPNYFVDISDTIETKLEALNIYASEKKNYPHARSDEALRMAAAQRGNAIGVDYAEAFMLVREVVK
jgi:LmbE family N-acetylglucosaminyl deacetylase